MLGFAILRNIGLALLLVCGDNLLIFSGIGFSSTGTSGGNFIGAIPGWVIGGIWTALFGSLGFARGVMEAEGSLTARRAARAVLSLLIACAAYPFYTIGLQNKIIGVFGNIMTICLSAWVAVQVGSVRPLAMIAPLAVIGWVAFATLALIDAGHFLAV